MDKNEELGFVEKLEDTLKIHQVPDEAIAKRMYGHKTQEKGHSINRFKGVKECMVWYEEGSYFHQQTKQTIQNKSFYASSGKYDRSN